MERKKKTPTTRITTTTIDPVPWERVLETIAAAPGVVEYTASINAIASHTFNSNPFHVLLATIISLRTRDEVTLPAARRLLDVAGTPDEIRRLPPERIEQLIYPAGFYRTKARTIIEVARIIDDAHAGAVPADVDRLVSLPGVGRKTANLVLGLGFGIPAICVDTHVHRVANRTGWVQTRTPDQTETALEKTLPRRYWIPINQWLVAFGRAICTPRSPRCSACPIRTDCLQIGVEHGR